MTDYVRNKKATFDYEILDKFEAGVVLYGHETKSIRSGKASLQGSYVILRGEEAFLVSATIPPYQEKNTADDYEADRPRKLLLNKKEIAKLTTSEKQSGQTIVPLRLYNAGRNIKLEIAIARGKKKHDKRQSIKAKDTARDVKRELKWQG